MSDVRFLPGALTTGHDNFAACIAHLEDFTEPDGTPTVHIVVDRVLTWIPADYEDRQLPFPEIQAELAQVISRFPHMRQFTYDQFGALATIRGTKDLLKLAGVKVPVRKLVHTEANNRERAEIVKEALANNWIHAPRDAFGPNGTSLLEQEMKFLQLRNLRLIKPTTGPVRTDDLWTAFSTVAWELLKSHYGRRVREALSRAPLLVGLPGGYHTSGPSEPGSVAPPRVARPRAMLEDIGRRRANVHAFNRRFRSPPPQGLRRPGSP